MQKQTLLLPQIIYQQYLTSINGIKFTPREIDIIACYVNGRDVKKVASLLSISVKTVETHTNNIMLKLDLHSRQAIISFVESSAQYDIVKGYYTNLRTRFVFDGILQKLDKLIPEKKKCFIKAAEDLNPVLFQQLKNDLRKIGIGQSSNLSHNIFEIGFQDNEVSVDGHIYSYYLAFLALIKKLYPDLELQEFITEINNQAQRTHVSFEGRQKNEQRKRSKILFYIAACAVLGIVLIIGSIPTKNVPPIRTDIILPNEAYLLKRPKMIQAIEERYKMIPADIKVVAFVGMGGSGKTTLARQYASSQKESVVWEIIADTRDNLISSFEKLAYSLSQTDEEKNEIKQILKISNQNEKLDLIVLFLKTKLKEKPTWFLIFDNVQKFSDIQNYFPVDSHAWGKGKIIITSRDENIQDNMHINQSLKIGELDQDEKLELFTRILNNKKEGPNLVENDQDKLLLLNHVPPFPLDISVAAYYLKATNIPVTSYITKINNSDDLFEATQAEVLKGVSDYNLTRYKIISISLEQLLEAHQDFKDLLIFMSLVDSQHIPRDLLEAYKGASVVDKFIFHLKKYSLLTDLETTSITPNFSIHRSTQEICRSYCVNNFKGTKIQPIIETISDTLSNYLTQALDDGLFSKMKFLSNHADSFLIQAPVFYPDLKYSIENELGAAYFYLGYYQRSKELLENHLKALKQHDKNNYVAYTKALGYLSCVYRDLGDYKKTEDLLNEALHIYQIHKIENPAKIAWVYAHLGILYKDSGEYEKAKDALNKSLIIYEQNPSQFPIRIAWATSILGVVYNELGEHEKSQQLINNSLLQYKKVSPDNKTRIACVSVQLGNVYYYLGKHKEAIQLLEESLRYFDKDFTLDHIETIRAQRFLGHLYTELKDYEKAAHLFSHCLNICIKSYGKQHIETALVLVEFAILSLRQKQFENAEKLLMESLQIFKNKDHAKIYLPLETLAELCILKQKNLPEQSAALTQQAISYLNDALTIINTRFPQESPHANRITNKIRLLENQT